MRRPFLVFMGGGIGSALRALLVTWLLPWGSVASVALANLVGSFVLGMVYVLADEAELLQPETRLFLAVGVLGGFTTFSTFGWGADILLTQRHPGMALLYLGVSIVGGVLAVAAGFVVGRNVGAWLSGWAHSRQ